MHEFKMILAQQKEWLRYAWRSFLLIALVLVSSTAPDVARAGQLEYRQCVIQLCTSYGVEENDCIAARTTCLNELNGPDQTPPQPAVPTLYGAIAIDGGTLITGAAKDYKTRADAERRAIAMCRRAGGSASGCQIVRWGHNICLALATSRENGGQDRYWGSGFSDDGWVSRKNAMKECKRQGGSACKIAEKLCTG